MPKVRETILRHQFPFLLSCKECDKIKDVSCFQQKAKEKIYTYIIAYKRDAIIVLKFKVLQTSPSYEPSI